MVRTIVFVMAISFCAQAELVLCDGRLEPCLMKTSGRAEVHGELALSADALVIKKNRINYEMVKGMVWFGVPEEVKIKTEYGIVTVAGDLIVDRSEEKWVRVVSQNNSTFVDLPGWGKLQVPNGFELSFSEIQSDGKSLLRELKVVSGEAFLQTVKTLPIAKEKIIVSLQDIKAHRKERVQSLANSFRQAGLRQIASEEAALKAKAARQNAAKQEQARYRAKLRSKVLGLDEE